MEPGGRAWRLERRLERSEAVERPAAAVLPHTGASAQEYGSAP